MATKNSFSLKQKALLKSFRHYRKAETALHPLNYLFWECTLRCNLSCLHCGSDCHVDSEVPDMPSDIFLREMEHIAQKYDPTKIMVVITGGEPLLRKDLPEIGFKLRKMGFKWGIVTNGYSLTPNIYNSLVNCGLGAITLSLDGQESDHNWIRNRQDAYSKAMNALNLILSTPRVQSDVVSCVNKRTINKLPEIFNDLKKRGLKTWRLFTITPIGRALDYPELDLSADEFTSLMNFIQAKRAENSELTVNFSCESYLGTYEGKVRDGLFFCRAGINIGSILADGSVSACPNIDRELIQGSIYKNRFTEIWENNFIPFRDRSWTKIGLCKTCKEYKYCEGSGLHWWRMSDKQLLKCHYSEIR
ncbi:MAG: TIGR04133 family radical SAM/SPASM protein [Bacteroidales bacterium]|nr:TIGR04133 family radical SAM/SPASM protein [Bacteroidales bacterium]